MQQTTQQPPTLPLIHSNYLGLEGPVNHQNNRRLEDVKRIAISILLGFSILLGGLLIGALGFKIWVASKEEYEMGQNTILAIFGLTISFLMITIFPASGLYFGRWICIKTNACYEESQARLEQRVN